MGDSVERTARLIHGDGIPDPGLLQPSSEARHDGPAIDECNMLRQKAADTRKAAKPMKRAYRRASWALAGATVVGITVLGAIGTGEAEQPQSQPDPTRQSPEPKQADSKKAKPNQTEPKIDPRADALLKKMSGFMAKQQRFTVHAEGELEVVLEGGQKLEFPFESDIKVQRPNKLRADRRGAHTDLRLLYDGNQIVLYGKILNMYAKAPAPPSLDAAIDHARDVLGLDAPGADLLYANAYAGLIPDVVSGIYLGTEMVRGVQCEHVAFHGKEVDFQVWIRAGATPTPCRYVVTTSGIDGKPEYSADLVSWDLSPAFDETVFTFKPPADATEIGFLTADEMKKHARQGHAKQPHEGGTP